MALNKELVLQVADAIDNEAKSGPRCRSSSGLRSVRLRRRDNAQVQGRSRVRHSRLHHHRISVGAGVLWPNDARVCVEGAGMIARIRALFRKQTPRERALREIRRRIGRAQDRHGPMKGLFRKASKITHATLRREMGL